MGVIGNNGEGIAPGQRADSVVWMDDFKAAVGEFGKSGWEGGDDRGAGMSARKRDCDGGNGVEDIVPTEDERRNLRPIGGGDVGVEQLAGRFERVDEPRVVGFGPNRVARVAEGAFVFLEERLGED